LRYKFVKWGIKYKRKIYFQIYGKRRAHEMHYRLSRCVNGLTVIPLITVRQSGSGRIMTLEASRAETESGPDEPADRQGVEA